MTNLVPDLLFLPRCCRFLVRYLKELVESVFGLYLVLLFGVICPSGFNMTSAVALTTRWLGSIESSMDRHRTKVLQYWRASPCSRRSEDGLGSVASKEDSKRQ